MMGIDIYAKCLAEVERAMADLCIHNAECAFLGERPALCDCDAAQRLALRLARMLAAMRADCSLCAGKGSATIGWGPNAVAGQCWYCDKVLRAVGT